MNLTKRLKSYFLRGLAVLLPALLTIWILAWGYGLVQNKVAIHINKAVVEVLVWKQHDRLSETALGEYRNLQEERFVKGSAGSVVGVLIAIVIIFLVGALLASVMGRTLWRIIEAFILNTPVLRRVYPYVKQVTDFLLTQEQQQKAFSRVVAVEYPRKGIWSLGFVTGSGFRTIVDEAEKEYLTVMIPTSPTPVTGWVITVPKEETVVLDMTLEEAFRFVMSAGVILPDKLHPVIPPAPPSTQASTGKATVFG